MGAGFIRPPFVEEPIKAPIAEGLIEAINQVRVKYPVLAPVALAPPEAAHGVSGFVAGELEPKTAADQCMDGAAAERQEDR